MPRRSVGTVAQPDSQAALAAHVASRLVGRLSDRAARDGWLEHQLGVKLRSNGVERAAPRVQGAVAPSVLVDEGRVPLALEKAWVAFPGRGRRRPRLVSRLRQLGFVRQLIVTAPGQDILCVVVYIAGERDAVLAALRAPGHHLEWREVVEEDRELERSAWMWLTRRLAASEGLLAG